MHVPFLCERFYCYIFIVTLNSITITASISYSTMESELKHIYDGLLPEKGPIALNVVTSGLSASVTHVIRHVLANGTEIRRSKMTDGYSRSKNATRMHKMRKNPEYCKRENECRNRQRKEVRARKKMDHLLCIPNRSILCETTTEVLNRTGTELQEYTVRKEVKTIQITTYTHEPIREAEKEKAVDVVVYRTEKGSIRRAW